MQHCAVSYARLVLVQHVCQLVQICVQLCITSVQSSTSGTIVFEVVNQKRAMNIDKNEWWFLQGCNSTLTL